MNAIPERRDQFPSPPGRVVPDTQTLIRLHLIMFGVGMVILGISQAAQPTRWDDGIYHDIYDSFSRPTWGVIFLAVGVFKLVCASWAPRLAAAALTAGALIIAWWAFVLCYTSFTDPRFPPSGAVAWCWLLGGHLGVAALLSKRRWGGTSGDRG